MSQSIDSRMSYNGRPELQCPPVPFDHDMIVLQDYPLCRHINCLAHDWKTYAEAWREYSLELEYIIKERLI